MNYRTRDEGAAGQMKLAESAIREGKIHYEDLDIIPISMKGNECFNWVTKILKFVIVNCNN